jgi:hypothetical protein
MVKSGRPHAAVRPSGDTCGVALVAILNGKSDDHAQVALPLDHEGLAAV